MGSRRLRGHGPGTRHGPREIRNQSCNVLPFNPLTKVVPFLVEDMLKELGAHFTKAADWQPHVVVDGLLITGQNPASSEPAARALLAKLRAA